MRVSNQFNFLKTIMNPVAPSSGVKHLISHFEQQTQTQTRLSGQYNKPSASATRRHTPQSGQAMVRTSTGGMFRQIPSTLKPELPYELGNWNSTCVADEIRHVLAVCNSGMLPEHLFGIWLYAWEHHQILGIRTINPASKTPLSEGFPTKPFHIKSKTAKWGPFAGLLCAQDFWDNPMQPPPCTDMDVKGNLHVHPSNEVDALIPVSRLPAVQDAIDQKYAIELPLLLTDARIKELWDNLEIGIHESESNKFNLGEQFTFYSSHKSNQFIHFQAVPSTTYYGTQKAAWTIMGYPHIFNSNKVINKPPESFSEIHVLGHPVIKKPLTADYDLLMVCTTVEEKDFHEDRHPLQPESFSALDEGDSSSDSCFSSAPHCEPGIRSALANLRYNSSQHEDPDMGNISPFLKRALKALNEHLNRGEHLELFHHNSDHANPHSHEEHNFPALFILPDPRAAQYITAENSPSGVSSENPAKTDPSWRTFTFSGQSLRVIQRDGFAAFIGEIKEKGWFAELNPRWKHGKAENPSFGQLRRFFGQLSAQSSEQLFEDKLASGTNDVPSL